MSVNGMESRQSTLIKAMRFPLIYLVVVVHVLEGTFLHVELNLRGWSVYHFFSEMVSHNLAKVSVSCFFFISGFLFFANMNEGEFSFEWVLNKWKKRLKTLLIPYIIWNLLSIAVQAGKSALFIRLGIGTSNYFPSTDFIYNFWTGPANFPLYFIRDLMIMSIVAPFMYLLFKGSRWVGLALLGLLYISPLNPGIPGMCAVFFFGIGAWMSIWKVDFISVCHKVKWPSLVLLLVSLFIATIWNDSVYHEWLLRVFYPFGLITFINAFDRLIDNKRVCNNLCALSEATFFIFAAHEIQIKGWTKGLLLRIFGDGLFGSWISYLLVPVIVLIVCLGLYRFFNMIIPKTLAFACGGRTNSKK